MSDDSANEYFADGVAEETITALSRMEWLMVAARNSSFVYKGQAVDAQQVGRELGVCYVLEGSVRKAASRGASLGGPIRGHAGGHLRSPGPGDG
jgi:adenylate cyclase